MSIQGVMPVTAADSSAAAMFAAMHASAGAPKANRVAAASGGSAGAPTGSGSLSVNNLGSTFLSLLSQELQNQDPTQPMDPTQMVGQMISLNELDQLIGINQTLAGAPGAAMHSAPTEAGPLSPSAAPGFQGFAAADVASVPSTQTAAAAAQAAYLNAAGALLAGTPSSSAAKPSVTITSLYGGK